MSASVVPFVQNDPNDPMQGGVPQAAPPPSAGVPVQQALPPNPDAVAAANPARGGGTGALAGILRALGGSVDTQYSVNPDNGQLAQSQGPPQGAGAYARQIIAGAVQGLAAGASAAPGPGHSQRGLAAGIQAGMGQARQQDQDKQDAVLGNYNRDQQSKVRSAQVALLNQQITRGSFDLSRQQVDAGEHDATTANEMADRVSEDPNAVDLGVVTAGSGMDHTHALSDMMAKHADALKAHANGHVISLPNITDGKYNGVHYWQVSPDWKNTKTTDPTPLRLLVPGKKDGDPGRYDVQNLPAGMTQGDVTAQLQAVAKDNLTTRTAENLQTQESARTTGTNQTQVRVEGIRANAELGAARIRGEDEKQAAVARLGNTADASGTTPMRRITQQIFDGRTDPSQLGKGKGSGVPLSAQLADLDVFAEQTGQPKINIAKLSADYAQAKGNVRGTLSQLNALVGPDNQGGVLNLLNQASAKLGQTRFPALNDTAQWAKLSTGDPGIAAYRGLLLDAQDLTAKVLAGGGSGGVTSDAKLKAGQDLYQSGFNASQMAAATGQQRQVIGMRKSSLIGNNFYLNRWYGQGGQGSPEEQEKQQGYGPQQNTVQRSPETGQSSQVQAPPMSALKAGHVTSFANGQSWQLGPDGKPQQLGPDGKPQQVGPDGKPQQVGNGH